MLLGFAQKIIKNLELTGFEPRPTRSIIKSPSVVLREYVCLGPIYNVIYLLRGQFNRLCASLAHRFNRRCAVTPTSSLGFGMVDTPMIFRGIRWLADEPKLHQRCFRCCEQLGSTIVSGQYTGELNRCTCFLTIGRSYTSLCGPHASARCWYFATS